VIVGALLAVSTLFVNVSQAQQVLRVTTIPEEAATEQMRKFGPLTKYLERTVGMKVSFVPVNDYPAAVEALVNKQVDLVWFGGFTYVQAQIRSGVKIVPLAQLWSARPAPGRDPPTGWRRRRRSSARLAMRCSRRLRIGVVHDLSGGHEG
jgi:ABC-type phosphate/phosphonate transport system substrate-binding protein